ncbi:MAG: hypothetical protein ACLUFN_00100 [Eubacterium sp.]
MPDNSIINSGERRINEAVCIDTNRIYDSCVSKDCLEDLRVTFFGDSQCLIDDAVTIKCRDCDICAVSIDVEEVPFNRGFYSVDINFYFKLRFDTYSEPCTTPQTAIGYANFEKKCILYGSDGNVKIFTSNTGCEDIDCPDAPQYTNPVVKVQAVDPVVLETNVIDACDCQIPCCTSFPRSILNTVNNSTIPDKSSRAVVVTLGLFSIVQIQRDVQMLIPAYDFCIPERECSCTTQNPCQTFQNIEFPVDEFFPPDREDIPGCSCNHGETTEE